MYLSVLLLPLCSCILVGFFGNYLGRRGGSFLSTFLIACSFIVSLIAFYEVGVSGSISHIKLFDWFSIGNYSVFWGFLFDTVTVSMLIVVTSISMLVHLYSTSYMEADPHLNRFMSYLSLFTFFMLCLVTGDNFIQLFLGWEGVGVSSYLLINFWFTRLQANKAALKAIIVNRFGDFGLIIALATIFFLFKSFQFGVVFSLVDSLSNFYIPVFSYELHGLSVLAFFFFLGAVGKSAQLGLHTWLPDAMEGPTPVSALIHAATMVTAGVFVLIRTSPILEYSQSLLIIVVILGALTAFFAGTVGVFQNDLKRVIAYSTCSQLGYMVFACGLSNYSVAMFHLMNHAFFKALLFLSAGSVIHALLDEQDMRRMGGLLHLMPFTYVMFIIGSLALMGFPFSTGFYSKDVILELAYSNYYIEGIFSYWLGVLGACCTAFYSYRLLFFTFLAETNIGRKVLPFVHDAPIRMALPLLILAFGSIFVGFIFKDMFIGLGTTFWGHSIGFYNSLGDVLLLEAEFINPVIKFFPVFMSILSASFAYVLYEYFPFLFFKTIKLKFGYVFYSFMNKKWFFDQVYNGFIVFPILKYGYNVTFKLIDRGFIELIGPTGLFRSFSKFIILSKSYQSGLIFNYIFGMVLSLISFIFFIGFANTLMVYGTEGLFFLLIFGVILYFTLDFQKKEEKFNFNE